MDACFGKKQPTREDCKDLEDVNGQCSDVYKGRMQVTSLTVDLYKVGRFHEFFLNYLLRMIYFQDCQWRSDRGPSQLATDSFGSRQSHWHAGRRHGSRQLNRVKASRSKITIEILKAIFRFEILFRNDATSTRLWPSSGRPYWYHHIMKRPWKKSRRAKMKQKQNSLLLTGMSTLTIPSYPMPPSAKW